MVLAWSLCTRWVSSWPSCLLVADGIVQTETDDVPLAVMAFQGRLVVGVGKSLRIYDIGKKKLLRKVENKVCHSNPLLFRELIACAGLRFSHRQSQYARVADHRW